MSAIFGVVGAATAAELDEMGSRLVHRGPFVHWRHVARGVYLGAAGKREPEPLRHESLTAVVSASATLRGDDAESIVAGRFAREGLAAFESGNQTFAIAAWDERTQSLLLARDFIGLKPLYYCVLPGGGIAFASEYKALLALAEVPAEPDLDALQYLQCHKRVPGNRTLLRNVLSVPPGAMLRFARNGTREDAQPMRPLALAVAPTSEDAACERIGTLLLEATRNLVGGCDRVGIALSGGIDSIGVAYACRRSAPEAELVAFTAGDDHDDPEIRTAAMVMEHLGGAHHPVIVTPRHLADVLPEVVWHLENPVGRSETAQFIELGRAAQARGFDWLMTGMSADALFAGMPRHKLLWLASRLPPLRRDLVEFYARTQSGRPPRRPLARIIDRLYFRGALPPVPGIEGARYTPGLPDLPPPGPEFLNRFLVTSAQEGAGLARIERTLQASGVDFATPFADRALMDYAFTLPDALKIRRGKEKYILRRALRALVPDELRNLPKFPMRMRYDEQFASTIDALFDEFLAPDRVRRRGFFRYDELLALRRARRRGRYDAEAAMRIWTAVATEIWAEQFLDRRGEPLKRRDVALGGAPLRAVG